MTRLLVALLVGVALCVGSAALCFADTAAVAAALPDEASECRYILRLCEAGRPQKEKLKAATADLNRRMEADAQNPPRTQLQRHERLRWGQFHQETIQQELDASIAQGKELRDAMTVVRSKHEDMPTCFEQCADVIKLDGLR